jgi:hypothetical protein
MHNIYNDVPENMFLGYIMLQLFCGNNLWFI